MGQGRSLYSLQQLARRLEIADSQLCLRESEQDPRVVPLSHRFAELAYGICIPSQHCIRVREAGSRFRMLADLQKTARVLRGPLIVSCLHVRAGLPQVIGVSAQSKDRVLESCEGQLKPREQLRSSGRRTTRSRTRCSVERLCIAEFGANLVQHLSGRRVREPVFYCELT